MSAENNNSTKQINPMLKLILEIGPLGIYFWAFKKFAETPLELFGQSYTGLVAAMVFFIPATIIGIAITYALTREISRMAIFTLVLITLIGGVTLFFNDDYFVKLRPTIVNALFGLILAFGLWVQKKSYFQYLMGEVMPLKDSGWFILTRNFIFFFFANAIINEFVRNFMSDSAFAFWDTFGQMGLTFVFFAAQFPLLSKHVDQSKMEKMK